MKLHYLFALLLIVSGGTIQAQNRVLIMQNGDSIPNVLALHNDGYNNGGFDYHISPTPLSIATAFPSGNNYIRSANKSVNWFQTWHLDYPSDPASDFLDVGQYWAHNEELYYELDSTGGEYDYTQDSIRRASLKRTLFGNKIIREALYTWLIPFYKAAFSIMSVPEQQAYLDMLADARNYAMVFDLEKEKATVESVENYASTRGFHNAFIYRRIVNKEIMRDEIISWIDRITADFKSVMRVDPNETDKYVLKTELGYGYFTACDYKDAEEYDPRKFIIMKEREGQFTILPDVFFNHTETGRSNFFYGSIPSTKEKMSHAFFYCDSACWVFTPTNYPGYYDDDYFFKGNGANTRIVLIHEVDYDYTDKSDDEIKRALCAIVDLDSGYIVADSFYIPIIQHYSHGDLVYHYPSKSEAYTIFQDKPTGLYGIFDAQGNIVLQPKYKSIEATDDPKIFKVNGKKKVKVP